MSAEQLALLARADIAKMPEWPTACVEALLAAPASFVRKDEAQMFTMEDVEFMKGESRDAVIAAVDVMGRCRAWVDAIGARLEPKAEFLIGLLDVNLVHHVHHKTCKERKAFQNLHAIGIDIVRAILAAFGAAAATVEHPFVGVEEAVEKGEEPAKAKASASANMSLRQFTGGVLDAASAIEMGFAEGTHLKAKHKKRRARMLHHQSRRGDVCFEN